MTAVTKDPRCPQHPAANVCVTYQRHALVSPTVLLGVWSCCACRRPLGQSQVTQPGAPSWQTHWPRHRRETPRDAMWNAIDWEYVITHRREG